MRLLPSQQIFQIDATQLTGARAAGFVWYAQGTMNAIVPLQVAGEGGLEVWIAASRLRVRSAPTSTRGKPYASSLSLLGTPTRCSARAV